MKGFYLRPFEVRLFSVLSQLCPDAYVVGGFVRDLLLRPKIRRKDIDVVCGDSLLCAKKVASALKDSHFVVLDKDRRIFRVVVSESFHLDFASLQGGSIERDLERRDFTLNAIALSPRDFSLIDPLKGRKDIEKQRLRICSDDAFKDDPLRILRAYSISADCGLSWARHLSGLVFRDSHLLKKVAYERINQELNRLFSSANTHKWFLKMYEDGLFEILFPEALSMESLDQGPYHHLDVLMHSFESLYYGEELLRKIKYVYNIKDKQLLFDYLNDYIGDWQRIALLKWVIFWHDLGKPISRRPHKGRIVFYGHNRSGAIAIRKMMRRLKFSQRQCKWAGLMVDMHLRPGDLTKAESQKAFYRFLRQCDGEDLAVFLLSWADARATRGEKNPFVNFTRHRKMLIEFINTSLRIKKQPVLPKLIDGNEVMKITGLPPGKEVGKILNEIKELQLAGKITTRKQAKAYVSAWGRGK